MSEHRDAAASGATIYATPMIHYLDGHAEAALLLRPAATALVGPGPDLTDPVIAGLLDAGFDLLTHPDQTPGRTDAFTATLTTHPDRRGLNHSGLNHSGLNHSGLDHLVITHRSTATLFDGALPATPVTTNPITGGRDTWVDIAATTHRLALTVATHPTDPTDPASATSVDTDTLGWLAAAIRAGHAIGATIPITIRRR